MQIRDKRALANKEPMQIGTKGYTMARRGNAEAEAEVEVVTPEDGETDVVAEGDTGTKPAKEAKAPKEPARGDLPEGYVTPVGFAKIISEPKDGNKENKEPSNWYHTSGKDGSHEVRPQMVYSYMKNAPKEDQFPVTTVKDSLEKDRQVVKPEDGIAWWNRKNDRVGERKTNAANKAQAKADRAQKAEAEKAAEGEKVEAGAVEAE